MSQPHTIINDQTALDQAYRLAKGCYQRNILSGVESLSGSTLRGKATSYAGRYAQSRANLIARIKRAGIAIGETIGTNGKRILVIG